MTVCTRIATCITSRDHDSFPGPQAVVVADDVQGNSAFIDWVSRAQPSYSAVAEEQSKQSLLGVAVLGA